MVNGNGNRYVGVELHYQDFKVASDELTGLVRLASTLEPGHQPLSVPSSVGLGTLRFIFRNTDDRRDFYKAIREDGSFTFREGVFFPRD